MLFPWLRRAPTAARSARARSYLSGCDVDETPPRGPSQRSGDRRAGSARGRVARTGASCRARGPGRGVLGARRPARRATACRRARAERHGRGRCARGPTSAHRGAATCAPRDAASRARPDRRRRDCCAGRGHRADRLPFGHVRRALPGRPSRRPAWRPAPRVTRRSSRHRQAGGSSSMRPAFPGSTAGASTRRGCGIPPACSYPSGRSTRAGTSRSGRACRRRTSRH